VAPSLRKRRESTRSNLTIQPRRRARGLCQAHRAAYARGGRPWPTSWARCPPENSAPHCRPIYLRPTAGIFSWAVVRPRGPSVVSPDVCGRSAEGATRSCIARRARQQVAAHVHRTDPALKCSNRAGSSRNPVPSAYTKGPACTNAGPLVFSCAGAIDALSTAISLVFERQLVR
jgi:hypothetical protein